jgi:hypothetical protein
MRYRWWLKPLQGWQLWFHFIHWVVIPQLSMKQRTAKCGSCSTFSGLKNNGNYCSLKGNYFQTTLSWVLIFADSHLIFQFFLQTYMIQPYMTTTWDLSSDSTMVYQLLCLTPQMICPLADGTSCFIFVLVDVPWFYVLVSILEVLWWFLTLSWK